MDEDSRKLLIAGLAGAILAILVVASLGLAFIDERWARVLHLVVAWIVVGVTWWSTLR